MASSSKREFHSETWNGILIFKTRSLSTRTEILLFWARNIYFSWKEADTSRRVSYLENFKWGLPFKRVYICLYDIKYYLLRLIIWIRLKSVFIFQTMKVLHVANFSPIQWLGTISFTCNKAAVPFPPFLLTIRIVVSIRCSYRPCAAMFSS